MGYSRVFSEAEKGNREGLTFSGPHPAWHNLQYREHSLVEPFWRHHMPAMQREQIIKTGSTCHSADLMRSEDRLSYGENAAESESYSTPSLNRSLQGRWKTIMIELQENNFIEVDHYIRKTGQYVSGDIFSLANQRRG